MRTVSVCLATMLALTAWAADGPSPTSRAWREVTIGEALAAAGRSPAQEPLAIPWLATRIALPPAPPDPQRDLRWCAWRLGFDQLDAAADAHASRFVRSGQRAGARLYDIHDLLGAETRAADVDALRRLAAADGDAAVIDGGMLVVRARPLFHERLERLLTRLRAGALVAGEPLWTESGDGERSIDLMAALDAPWHAAAGSTTIDAVIDGIRRAGVPLVAVDALHGEARLEPPPAEGERLRAVVDRIADALDASWRTQDGLVLLAPRGAEPWRWRALWLPARARASVDELVRAIAIAIGDRPGAAVPWRGGALVLAVADAATTAVELTHALDAAATRRGDGF